MPHFQRISLVHYHELGLKGHNRSTFERHLMRNLSSLLEDAPVEKVTRISGRVLVMYQASADASEIAEAADLIARVPGVARVSCGFVCDRELDQRCTPRRMLSEAGASIRGKWSHVATTPISKSTPWR
ncbi:MAG: hypothetical protein ACLTQI_00185 [Slackia sp.]